MGCSRILVLYSLENVHMCMRFVCVCVRACMMCVCARVVRGVRVWVCVVRVRVPPSLCGWLGVLLPLLPLLQLSNSKMHPMHVSIMFGFVEDLVISELMDKMEGPDEVLLEPKLVSLIVEGHENTLSLLIDLDHFAAPPTILIEPLDAS